MTKILNKQLQNLFKNIFYNLFLLLYGNIKGTISYENDERIKVKEVSPDNVIKYKTYVVSESRLYTNTIHDTAIILDNKLVEGASFQLRENKNDVPKNNIVLKIGTPRIIKRFRGIIVSLLTGGGGNSNYYHWLYDVLPRLKLISDTIDLEKVDYFLFPNIRERFQTETLNLLKIPLKKRISSLENRHLSADKIITTEHPWLINNDPINDPANLPKWIPKWLNDHLDDNEYKFDNSPKKFFIDRSDSKSNHRFFRSISNEVELKKFLIQKGFEIVSLSNLSFNNQVKLFRNAEIIIGLHGAGFSNLAFCTPSSSTKIIELKTETTGDMYSQLATKNNKFIPLAVKSQNTLVNTLGEIMIPLEKLEKLIND